MQCLFTYRTVKDRKTKHSKSHTSRREGKATKPGRHAPNGCMRSLSVTQKALQIGKRWKRKCRKSSRDNNSFYLFLVFAVLLRLFPFPSCLVSFVSFIVLFCPCLYFCFGLCFPTPSLLGLYLCLCSFLSFEDKRFRSSYLGCIPVVTAAESPRNQSMAQPINQR